MWGGLSGILFFIVLVAGASAKRAQVKELTEAADLVKERQEDEARRWLAAVAVRCSIVMGFEHGGSLLGTFKNMLCIQDKLSGRDKILRQDVIGPDRRAAPQHGFGDFAWDFLAEDK
jgi:predicted alternative tryptophan synthase beta-subunit